MKRNEKGQAVLFGAMVLTLIGCSGGHLTRANAKAQLDELHQKYSASGNESHNLLFKIGTVSNTCNRDLRGYDIVESSAIYPVLSSTEYITIKPIKKHVWHVELTDRGKRSIAGEPYAHEQNGVDCDQWQVSMPLSKFDHLDVTGILEDGVHAKVDVAFTFAITPAGIDAKKVAEKYVFEADKKKFGDKLAHDFLSGSFSSLLSNDIAYAPVVAKTYVKRGSIMFNKYDDGWKPDEHSAKDKD